MKGYSMDILLEYLKAFLVGGILCVIGQLLIDITKLTPARILVSFVVAGVILGALDIYEPVIDLAGAGATVPLTGFGNMLAKGMREAIDKDGFIGIFTGGFSACAAGVCAAIVFGFLVSIIFKKTDRTLQE